MDGTATLPLLTGSCAQGPVLVIIKVGISLYALARWVGVRQKTVFSIKWVRVSVVWKHNNNNTIHKISKVQTDSYECSFILKAYNHCIVKISNVYDFL